jgi:hypothetical protein
MVDVALSLWSIIASVYQDALRGMPASDLMVRDLLVNYFGWLELHFPKRMPFPGELAVFQMLACSAESDTLTSQACPQLSARPRRFVEPVGRVAR